MLYENLTEQIIGAAIEVHRHLGPGLLESTYRAALAHEFFLRRLAFRKEIELPVCSTRKLKLGFSLTSTLKNWSMVYTA